MFGGKASVPMVVRLPGGSGLLVLDALKSARADTNVVVLTGYGSIATAVDV